MPLQKIAKAKKICFINVNVFGLIFDAWVY
jgi:hypothetical protein